MPEPQVKAAGQQASAMQPSPAAQHVSWPCGPHGAQQAPRRFGPPRSRSCRRGCRRSGRPRSRGGRRCRSLARTIGTLGLATGVCRGAAGAVDAGLAGGAADRRLLGPADTGGRAADEVVGAGVALGAAGVAAGALGGAADGAKAGFARRTVGVGAAGALARDRRMTGAATETAAVGAEDLAGAAGGDADQAGSAVAGLGAGAAAAPAVYAAGATAAGAGAGAGEGVANAGGVDTIGAGGGEEGRGRAGEALQGAATGGSAGDGAREVVEAAIVHGSILRPSLVEEGRGRSTCREAADR